MSRTRHVLPMDDAIDHERTSDCICGPRVEPVPMFDGQVHWIVVHHSLDGRERKV